MATVDIFERDPFRSSTLSHRYSRLPFQPMKVNNMGLFETKGIRTTSLQIQETNGSLELIDYTPRGADPQTYTGSQGRMLRFETGHFPLKRVIKASDIQDIHDTEDETELEGVESVVRDKVLEMVPSHSVTLEYQRLGALKGYLLGKDGSIWEDLFMRFKIEQYPVFDFELDDNLTDVKRKCHEISRMISAALGNALFTKIRAFCGPEFFDDLITHPEVKEAYKRWNEGQFLREGQAYGSFEFGGIIWEEYRGEVSGIPFVADNECHLFPEGAAGMYITRFSPADMFDFVNTNGLPLYTSIEPLPHNKGVEVYTESNPTSICVRPKALIRGKNH